MRVAAGSYAQEEAGLVRNVSASTIQAQGQTESQSLQDSKEGVFVFVSLVLATLP